MKNLLIYTVFLVSGFLMAQNTQHTNSIQGNFSTQNIAAYQGNSVGMIHDFYEYLSLYSNEKDSDLKKQIKENILSLLHSTNFQIKDVFQNPKNTISLEELLEQVDQNKYQFHVDAVEVSKTIQSNQWTNYYELKIQKGKEITTENLEQIIHFQPQQKEFGSKSKIVWTLKLGSVQ